MFSPLPAGEQERRLLAQLPFDEATEQMEQPVPIGRRQLVPAAAHGSGQRWGGALGCCSDEAGMMDIAHQLPVENRHNPAEGPAVGSPPQAG